MLATKKDRDRGILYLIFRDGEIEVDSYEQLEDVLTQYAESEAENFDLSQCPEAGWPGVSTLHVVERVLRKFRAAEFFFDYGEIGGGKELFTSQDTMSKPGLTRLSIDLSTINEELVRYLAKHPSKMRDLHPRKFEELVAEIFRDLGYEVELTRFSKDGGFDIRAVRRTDVGLGLTLIECKRYSPDRPIGVSLIRNLFGVVQLNRATNGLVVTTSFFTRDAKALSDDHRHRLALADYDKLTDLLGNYRARGRG